MTPASEFATADIMTIGRWVGFPTPPSMENDAETAWVDCERVALVTYSQDRTNHSCRLTVVGCERPFTVVALVAPSAALHALSHARELLELKRGSPLMGAKGDIDSTDGMVRYNGLPR